MNVDKNRNDLTKTGVTMGDRPSLCVNVAMVTGNPNRYLQEETLKGELCPGGGLEEGRWQDSGAASATRYEAGAFYRRGETTPDGLRRWGF